MTCFWPPRCPQLLAASPVAVRSAAAAVREAVGEAAAAEAVRQRPALLRLPPEAVAAALARTPCLGGEGSR